MKRRLSESATFLCHLVGRSGFNMPLDGWIVIATLILVEMMWPGECLDCQYALPAAQSGLALYLQCFLCFAMRRMLMDLEFSDDIMSFLNSILVWF